MATAKYGKTIRKAIFKLVNDRLHELGDVKLQQLSFDTHCTLCNPLCPADLCILPYGHVGTEEGYHVLGTTNYEFAERLVHKGGSKWESSRSAMIMYPEGTPVEELVAEGWRIQEERFPGD